MAQNTQAQFLKKLAKHAEDKISREAERRSERRVDKKIDKSFDKVEDEIDGKNQPQKSKSETDKSNKTNGLEKHEPNDDSKQAPSTSKPTKTKTSRTDTYNKPTVIWSKFDFVPGDVVVFEDGPSEEEENGEFPSRWDLHKGNVEIGEVNGENIIMFLPEGRIVPYLKNSKEDYLPEIFTIEFDVFFSPEVKNQRYWLSFFDKKNQHDAKGVPELQVKENRLGFGNSSKKYPGSEKYHGGWRHISVAYTKGKFKAYMDDTRLINIPHLVGNPTGVSIFGAGEKVFLKNVRIAKGGVKYYDRVLTDGKIIVNGIKFDVNKATLKPESMGPINKIYKLMVKNHDLKFSVEGHTDGDGTTDSNLSLSEKRAQSVMHKLINLGIDTSRLTSKGFGESKPLDNNNTPEGKANNRRVEFVKF